MAYDPNEPCECIYYEDAESRISELEKALRDAVPFVAIHVSRWAEGNGGKMHEVHRELLDRIGRLTDDAKLSERLGCLKHP